MAMTRLAMRKVREILRLRLQHNLSFRDVARSCNVSASTVRDCLLRARMADINWPVAEALDEAELEGRLYRPSTRAQAYVAPDYPHLFKELARRGVTLQLLWQEYCGQHGARAYQYSQFTVLYQRWRKQLDVTMRQDHRAGEKLFIDFAGQTLPIIDPKTGQHTEAQIFVATLGASSYTYAEALPSQELSCWIDAHCRAFEFFGGVPAIVVPDNLKSGVHKACRYEPDINPSYMDMAHYYHVAVIPTRVRKPRDKAKVENGVQQVERWVLAPLRNHHFHSLQEMNDAIAERVAWLNARRFAKLSTTRHELFCELDKPALKQLPPTRFVCPQWKCDVTVTLDYHVEFDLRRYSVPYQLAGKRVDIRATSTTVECLFKGKRIALHQRITDDSTRCVTDPNHRSKAHQRYADMTPSRLLDLAASVGPQTSELIKRVLARWPHPEQGYRSCLGILQLRKMYSQARLEAACQRAQVLETYSYKSLASMLRTGMEAVPIQQPSAPVTLPTHENIRGPNYYGEELET